MSEIGQDRRGAWRAALACMVTLAVAMGLGRFAFTPMLPIMLHEGKLELEAGGLLASLNYLGYFVGAVSCAAIGVRAKTMVRGGLLATALSLCGLALAVDATGAFKLAVLVLLGLGVGATITAASNAIMNNAPAEHAGMAASIEEVSYELGGVLGIALLGSVLSSTYTATLAIPDTLAVPASARDGIDGALLAAETLPTQAGTQLVALAHTAFDQAFFAVMAVAVAIVVAAACSVALLGRRVQPARTSC